MDRILLFLDHRQNQKLLASFLADRHHISIGKEARDLDRPTDLIIVDGPALDRLAESIYQLRQAEAPVFLPVLFISSRKDIGLATRHLWKTLDELVFTPIEKIELQARVAVLLRARRYSRQLRDRTDDLEAFSRLLLHDLRAPIRAVQGFAKAIIEDYGPELPDAARNFLARILDAGESADLLINTVHDYLKLDHAGASLQEVSLQGIVEDVLAEMRELIEEKRAVLNVEGPLPKALGDSRLLKTAFRNLIDNALKFVEPGRRPSIRIFAMEENATCVISVQDSGIGIPKEYQNKIFEPFFRLHGQEEYPGTGIGLSIVRKVVALMDGRLGVVSEPGKGTTFWIALHRSDA